MKNAADSTLLSASCLRRRIGEHMKLDADFIRSSLVRLRHISVTRYHFPMLHATVLMLSIRLLWEGQWCSGMMTMTRTRLDLPYVLMVHYQDKS